MAKKAIETKVLTDRDVPELAKEIDLLESEGCTMSCLRIGNDTNIVFKQNGDEYLLLISSNPHWLAAISQLSKDGWIGGSMGAGSSNLDFRVKLFLQR